MVRSRLKVMEDRGRQYLEGIFKGQFTYRRISYLPIFSTLKRKITLMFIMHSYPHLQAITLAVDVPQ